MNIKNIVKRKPLELLVPSRLDIIVKYLYIKALQKGDDIGKCVDLYKKHILKRTGGRQGVYQYCNEEVKEISKKESVEQYIEEFNDMINSFKKNGFLNEFFIPVSCKNSIILDGSHRTSCCIYFNVNPYVIYEERKGRSWDYEWFVQNGFNTDEINLIIDTYIQLKRRNIFTAILWGTVKENWDEIQDEIQKQHDILMTKDCSFEENTFESIVYDIYSYEFGIDLPNKICKKVQMLKKYNTDLRLIFFNINEPQYKYIRGDVICTEVIKLKKHIRSKWNSKVDKDKFITIHTSDNDYHTEHIKNIFLSTNNLVHLNNRKIIYYRKKFLDWLIEFEDVLTKYNVLKDECCIVGSSPLEVLGIRESTDIDFILHSRKRNLLFEDTSKSLSENVDIVHKGYHVYNNVENPIKDDEIIDNSVYHFYFRGFKFANINIIRDRKSNHGRPKDVKDVKLIDMFLKSN